MEKQWPRTIQDKKPLTSLKHGEVCRVDRQEMNVGGEPGNQLDQSIVDGLVRVAVPTRQDASLWRCQEELEKYTS